MIEEFWLGALVVSTLVLSLVVLLGTVGVVVAARYLRAFTAIHLHKDPIDGRFNAQVEVIPNPTVDVEVE